MKVKWSEENILLLLVVLAEIAMGISPRADRLTWFLENLPVFILLPVLYYKQPQWRLSRFTFRLLTIHALVLMVGGYYTYAEVPFGFWLQEVFDFKRNHYDRIGHFLQGFVPAFAFRELLLRYSSLNDKLLLRVLVVCICLSISAFYEFIEWWAALILGHGSSDFLGTQGDIWDAQWDMFLAFAGASAAMVLVWRKRESRDSKQAIAKS